MKGFYWLEESGLISRDTWDKILNLKRKRNKNMTQLEIIEALQVGKIILKGSNNDHKIFFKLADKALLRSTSLTSCETYKWSGGYKTDFADLFSNFTNNHYEYCIYEKEKPELITWTQLHSGFYLSKFQFLTERNYFILQYKNCFVLEYAKNGFSKQWERELLKTFDTLEEAKQAAQKHFEENN